MPIVHFVLFISRLGFSFKPKIGYLSEFEVTFLDLMASYIHIIVAGDFNAALLGPKTFNSIYLTNMFYTCNMTILPLYATHFTSTSSTFLDIMAVSDMTQIVDHVFLL